MTDLVSVQSIVFQTDDFGALEAASPEWDQRYLQLSPGNFKGSLDMTQIGTRQIFRERWNRKIRYQGTAPQGTFGFALPFHQHGPANWVGKTTCEDTIILQAPGQEADLVSSAFWDALVLSIPEEEVHSLASALSDDDNISTRFHGAITLKPQVAAKLRRMGREFLYQPQPCSLDAIDYVSCCFDQFVKLFLLEVVKAQESSSFVVTPDKPANIVRQATELVLNDETSGIGLAELCNQLGVSLRTLHYAFQDATGLSPATWLRRIRLNRVHTALLQASPEDTFVKQVAIDHGFLHLGHFGEQYKRLFGCSPVQTLHS